MKNALAVAERRQIPPTVVLVRWLRPALRGLARWAVAARNRSRTRRVLGRLDEAGLKDIGLVRSQISGIERGPRYRTRS